MAVQSAVNNQTGSHASTWRQLLADAPIPHEHGAWVILYAPVLIALIACRSSGLPALLLIPAVTGGYLARNAAGLLLRRRRESANWIWLGIYTGLFLAGALPLLLAYHRLALLEVGALMAAAFVVHGVLVAWPARKRLDRSKWGEVLGVFALALTGPAAYAAVLGILPADAWRVWAACALFFSSAIFHVKMMLEAAKSKTDLTTADRLRLGRDNLIYSAVMFAGAIALGFWFGGTAGVLAGSAFVPGIVRSLWRNAKLSHRLPNLKRVGLQETLLSLWFMAALAASLLIQH